MTNSYKQIRKVFKIKESFKEMGEGIDWIMQQPKIRFVKDSLCNAIMWMLFGFMIGHNLASGKRTYTGLGFIASTFILTSYLLGLRSRR
jgi:hypothetical protein